MNAQHPPRRNLITVALCPALCGLLLILWAAPRAQAAPETDGKIKEWCCVYFTAPGRGNRSLDRNPRTALIKLLDGARSSVFGAFYNISSPEVTAALLRAKGRGVDVRIVTETDNIGTPQVAMLRTGGIHVAHDRRRGLMHHKFAVIDGKTVWTGSYNITPNGALRNNNNAIKIDSPELAAIFSAEFREMHGDGVFGNSAEPGVFPGLTSKYYVKIQDTPVNVYFSPEDSIERILLKRLRKAKTSVRFMAYSFTSAPLAEELIRLHKKGLTVSGILEKAGAEAKYSQYIKMKLEGIPVHMDTNPASMHHKVMIIDDEILVTGSYNFSKGADRKNDENIIIIADRDIAGRYIEEFERLKPR